MKPPVSTALLLLTLLFPALSPSASASDWIYYARKGDTLWDLCLQYTNKRGCWLELAKHNAIGNDRAIGVGEEIRIPGAWLITPPVVGSVLAVAGEVSYYQTSSAPPSELRQGQQLHLGARLVTAIGSARLRLGAENELLLRDHSVLLLDTMSGPSSGRSSTELSLPKGSVEVRVKADGKSRFHITTPAAIASVRGTEYRVNSLEGVAASTRSEVLSGAVDVASGNKVAEVAAGFGVAANKGEAPGKPRRLLPAPVFTRSANSTPLPARVEWRANPAAANWKLDLLQAGPSAALLDSYSTDTPYHVFETLEPGCYTLRLRAVDGDGFNGLDSTAPLCVVAPLPAISELSNITLNRNGNLQLSWSPVPGAQQYRLEIAANNDFSDIIDTRVTNATAFEFSRSPDSAFSVRVIAIGADGNESLTGTSREFRPQQNTNWPQIITGLIILLIIAI